MFVPVINCTEKPKFFPIGFSEVPMFGFYIENKNNPTCPSYIAFWIDGDAASIKKAKTFYKKSFEAITQYLSKDIKIIKLPKNWRDKAFAVCEEEIDMLPAPGKVIIEPLKNIKIIYTYTFYMGTDIEAAKNECVVHESEPWSKKQFILFNE